MAEPIYCEYCGGEVVLKQEPAPGEGRFCSAGCRAAAEKQARVEGGRRQERILVSGRSPWSR